MVEHPMDALLVRAVAFCVGSVEVAVTGVTRNGRRVLKSVDLPQLVQHRMQQH